MRLDICWPQDETYCIWVVSDIFRTLLLGSTRLSQNGHPYLTVHYRTLNIPGLNRLA